MLRVHGSMKKQQTVESDKSIEKDIEKNPDKKIVEIYILDEETD